MLHEQAARRAHYSIKVRGSSDGKNKKAATQCLRKAALKPSEAVDASARRNAHAHQVHIAHQPQQV